MGMTVDAKTLFRLAGLPEPQTEYLFHPERKWRFDYCWEEWALAVEIEGGVHVRGRHVRGKGYEDDCEKYSWAAVLGWRVIRLTPGMVKDGRALALLEEAKENSI